MNEVAQIEEPEPWERLPDESVTNYRHFQAFASLLNRRTLARAAELVGRSPHTLAEVSAKYRWVARAEAYEMYMLRRLREQRESEIEELEREERRQALLVQRYGMERIAGRRANGDLGEIPELDPTELSPETALQYVRVGQDLRRRADGQPTDFVRNTGDLSQAEVARLLTKVVEVALPLIPEELHERFIIGVRSVKL